MSAGAIEFTQMKNSGDARERRAAYVPDAVDWRLSNEL